MIAGHPALRLLARLKLKGMWRRQVRRFKRPSGAIFALLGLLVIGAWVASVIFGQSMSPRSEGADPALFALVQLVATSLTVFTIAGAMSHRGLYLPRQEIEILFAAPVSRSNLVRYRLQAALGRSLFGALFFGLVVMMRMPRPAFAFPGAMLAMMTLPVVGQAASVLAGDAENRLFKRLARLPFRLVSVVGALFLVAVVILAMNGERAREKLSMLGLEDGVEGLLSNPWVRAVIFPMRPWARMVTAVELGDFLIWFGVCAGIWACLFEATARIPVDFRELSLQTSADIARRIHRARKGGVGASGSSISKRAAQRSAPWVFGTGPFGAVAWRKTVSILRKARGTFITGGLIIALLTVVSTIIEFEDDAMAAAGGTLIIAAAGTLYLCAGLRFDFREDLDRMDVVKSWPMRPWKVFLAVVLPEVVLVSLLLAGAIGARSLFTGQFHPAVWLIGGVLPLAVLGWVAIDNAVFLYAPVRYVPGQEGLLHHAGRSMVLMGLRGLVTVGVGAGVLVGVLLVDWAQEPLSIDPRQALALKVAFGMTLLVGENVLLIWLGGRMFDRFDVARDRG